jgi:hypothetical protein
MTIATLIARMGRGLARRVADRESVLDERANMESTSAPLSRAPRSAPLVTWFACTGARRAADAPAAPPSTSTVGFARINLQFGLDRDINGAAHDVQAAINAAYADLPTKLRSKSDL